MLEYDIKISALSEDGLSEDATAAELRTLIVLISRNGKINDFGELAKLAKTSKPRAIAAVALWQEMGIIKEKDSANADGNIFEEFLPREPLSAPIEEGAEQIAKDIRDNKLSSLIAECARLMGKPMLSTAEAKKIVLLSTQYSLDEEYIITLAAHLLDKGKLTVTRLAADAERLVKGGIDCAEELERHLAEAATQSSAHMELKRLVGIRRNLSPKEKEYAERWFYDFGFSSAIVSLAFDINVSKTNQELSFAYMNTLLEKWHGAGCKTLEECKAFYESDRASIAAEYKKKNAKEKKEKPALRYGEFDVNDAFSKALTRSYGDEEN